MFGQELKLLCLKVDSSDLFANTRLIGSEDGHFVHLHWDLTALDGVGEVSGNRAAVICLNLLLHTGFLLRRDHFKGVLDVYRALLYRYMDYVLVFNFHLTISKASSVCLEQEVWLLVCSSADLEVEWSVLRPIGPGLVHTRIALWLVCVFQGVGPVHESTPCFRLKSHSLLRRFRHWWVARTTVSFQLWEKSGLILCSRWRIRRLPLWILLCLIW